MKPVQKSFPNRLLNFLGGLKLSFFLLVLLGGLAVQRALMAQKTIAMEEAPRFLRFLNSLGVASFDTLSIPLLVVLVLFVLNLTLSSWRMARRIRVKQQSTKSFKTAGEIAGLPNLATLQTAKGSLPQLIAFFKKRRYSVAWEETREEARLHACRRQLGLWGLFFFHLSFMVLLVGVLLSAFTRYAGYVELSPGGVFIEKRQNYRRVTPRPLLFGEDRQFGLRLDSIDLSYWQPGVVKQRASNISIFAPNGAFLGHKRIEINSPLHLDGDSVYQGNRLGFLAELEVTDSKGQTIYGNAVFTIPDKQGKRMIDTVRIGRTGLRLEVELFTEKIGDIPGLEPLRSTHMATLLKVTSIEQGSRVFRGVIFRGSKLAFEGLTFRFTSLKPYTSLVVSRDYGVPVIFVSFALLLVGLLAAYFWVPESYWVLIKTAENGESVIIGATTERYKEAFKERFAQRVSEFRAEVAKS